MIVTNESDIDSSNSTLTNNRNHLNEANDEFLNTGRTGRRNAVPNILNSNMSNISWADLPDRLQSLSTIENSNCHFYKGIILQLMLSSVWRRYR